MFLVGAPWSPKVGCLLINRLSACIPIVHRITLHVYRDYAGRILFPNCILRLDKERLVLLLAFHYGEDGFHDCF